MHTLAARAISRVLPVLLATAAVAGPPAGTSSAVESWSDAVWNAARTGNRAEVDRLLQAVPDGEAQDAVTRLREGIAQRDAHTAQSREAAQVKRVEKRKEIKDAIAAGQTTKALVAGAYLKYLSDNWTTEVQSPEIRELVAFAEKQVDQARRAGDWVQAEDLLTRLRTLYEGTPLREQYHKYDELLKVEVSPRVMMILEYAPRTWHALSKAQYERRDPKDRPRPFPEFSEKGKDDWKNQLVGITEPMLRDALAHIAAQHLDHVGWKPLVVGGLTMVKLLATTPALQENFPMLGDTAQTGRFASAVQQQINAVEAMPDVEVNASVFSRVMAALRTANEETVQLPFEVVIREFGDGAIATMVHDYEDPYTEIIWPDRVRRFNQAIRGNFVGVGVAIRHNENREIFVVNPLDGSPAKQAGIKPQDKIVAVDGVPTADWSIDRAVDAITGPAGTTVRLTIARDGKDGEPSTTFDVPLKRKKIKMYSVQGWRKTGYNREFEPQWDWYIDPDAGIGYLALTGFNEDTYQDFLTALNQMSRQRQLNGLVLDLRGNPGGLMESAVRVANTFMKRGRIVSVENRDQRELSSREANPQHAPLASLPTVVLINEGSASASEIVSGALEAHDAAVVVGERSFGKGSVQEVQGVGDRRAGSDTAMVKLTVQHYLLPPKPGQTRGKLVHKRPGAEDWGVEPDYVVRLTPVQMEEIVKIRASANDIPLDEELLMTPSEEPLDASAAKGPAEKRDPLELITTGADPQLQTALILLQSRVLKDLERQMSVEKVATPAAAGGKETGGKTAS